MSNTNSLAKRLPELSAAAPHEAPLARPKVMRRPSQFSSTRSSAAPAPAPALHTAAPAPAMVEEKLPGLPVAAAAPAAAATRYWHEDVRFGIALIAIVLLVNAALILWLPTLRTTPPVIVEQESAQDAAEELPEPANGVTLYTKPAPHIPPAWADDDQLDPAEQAPPVHILGGDEHTR